jgi:hypothetical protein
VRDGHGWTNAVRATDGDSARPHLQISKQAGRKKQKGGIKKERPAEKNLKATRSQNTSLTKNS